MAYANYPASLPCCQVIKGKTITPTENTITFTPDRGVPMARQATTKANFLVPWEFYANAAQVEVWKQFFHQTLRDGSARFRAAHPRSKKVETFKFEGLYSDDCISADFYLISAVARQIT